MKTKCTIVGCALWAALPMAHTSKIESRLTMILNTKAHRSLTPRAVRISLLAAAALLLPIAALRPAPANDGSLENTAAQRKSVVQTPEPAWALMTVKDKLQEKSLKQAEAKYPADSRWPDKLGFLYSLHVADDGSPQSRAWARAALVQYDRSMPLAEAWMVKTRHVAPFTGEPYSAQIARMALAAGDFDRARRCATLLLPPASAQGQGWNSSDRVQTANLVLGRLALRDGQPERAEKRLLAMGQIPGSPALGTFGPNMRLAKDLLIAGHRDAVLVYFDECEKFWKVGQIETWRTEVKQGKIPDFGVSLYN